VSSPRQMRDGIGAGRSLWVRRMDEKTKRIDWHRVLSWSLLYTAGLLIVLAIAFRGGRIPTLLDPRGREIARRALSEHFPGFAQRYRIGGGYGPYSSMSSRVHPR
jgi:hypothetical protein